MARVEIRPLRTYDEYRQCERLQMVVWGSLGVGSEVLTVTQKYGGVVLGSLLEGRVIGFIYAFLARYRGRLAHWSHMMAVEVAHRDRGLGFRMKGVHRKLALKQGIKFICWTFDPLQSRNATLNIFRLGALPEEYVPDCYGNFPSVIEKGLPSDRFIVNWRIASERVGQRLRGTGPSLRKLPWPVVNETHKVAEVFSENRKIRLDLGALRLLVEIPSNTDEMRSKIPRLAKRWRMETRQIFQHYFSEGYRVEDFIPPFDSNGPRCFYILRRH
jgi:predicted GNAT superfamily acetyltransferase